MTQFNRKDYEARYALFNRFALNDQRNYYSRTIDKHRLADGQVNRIRATLALITTLSSALAGLLILNNFTAGQQCEVITAGYCANLQGFIAFLVILSVAMPALGGFFTSLADLYQWDRLISIYEAAIENIEVADARSPLEEMDDIDYLASLQAFSEGTLQVMSDETAQWGQSIRTPRAIEEFVKDALKKTNADTNDSDNSIG